jgi:hypothetical protein
MYAMTEKEHNCLLMILCWRFEQHYLLHINPLAAKERCTKAESSPWSIELNSQLKGVSSHS